MCCVDYLYDRDPVTAAEPTDRLIGGGGGCGFSRLAAIKGKRPEKTAFLSFVRGTDRRLRPIFQQVFEYRDTSAD